LSKKTKFWDKNKIGANYFKFCRQEIKRRYDIDGNDALTFEEAREWVFCFAPFLDVFETRPESGPESAPSLCGESDGSNTPPPSPSKAQPGKFLKIIKKLGLRT